MVSYTSTLHTAHPSLFLTCVCVGCTGNVGVAGHPGQGQWPGFCCCCAQVEIYKHYHKGVKAQMGWGGRPLLGSVIVGAVITRTVKVVVAVRGVVMQPCAGATAVTVTLNTSGHTVEPFPRLQRITRGGIGFAIAAGVGQHRRGCVCGSVARQQQIGRMRGRHIGRRGCTWSTE